MMNCEDYSKAKEEFTYNFSFFFDKVDESFDHIWKAVKLKEPSPVIKTNITGLSKAKTSKGMLRKHFTVFMSLRKLFGCPKLEWLQLFCHLFSSNQHIPHLKTTEKKAGNMRNNGDQEFVFSDFGLAPIEFIELTPSNEASADEIPCGMDIIEEVSSGTQTTAWKVLSKVKRLENRINFSKRKNKELSRKNVIINKQLRTRSNQVVELEQQVQDLLTQLQDQADKLSEINDMYLDFVKFQELNLGPEDIDRITKGDSKEELPFPKVSTRDPKNIQRVSPAFQRAIIALSNQVKIDQNKIQPCIKIVANTIFGQTYTYNEKKGDKRSQRKDCAYSAGDEDSTGVNLIEEGIDNEERSEDDNVNGDKTGDADCTEVNEHLIEDETVIEARNEDETVSVEETGEDTLDGIENDNPQKKRKITRDSLPSRSYASYLDNKIEPVGMKSVAKELVKAKNATIGVDGTDHKRKHYIASQILVPKLCSDGITRTTNYLIDFQESTASSAESLHEHIMNVFRKLSFLVAEDPLESEDLVETQKQFAHAIKYWNSDQGAEMMPACKLFAKWQESLGAKGVKYLKCLAHLIVGLESEADKVISSLECKTEQLKELSIDITQSYLESANKSLYFTVAYAFLRLVGKSCDSVSYSMSDGFNTFLKDLGEKNYFIDVKKARFGKFFLIGRDLTCMMEQLDNFLKTHMKENRLYESCQFYMNNCPYLFETSLALGLLYYHIIYPLMRATGIEGDVYPLTHEDFLVLLPAVQSQLTDIYKCPDCLLEKQHLKPFLEYTDVLKFPKDETAKFNTLFDVLEKRSNINKSIVLSLCKAICLKFTFCLERQIGPLYLRGENSQVSQMIKENPEGMKTAAVNNLGCEHHVAQFKNLSNANPSAPTEHISRRMRLPKSPFIINIGKMSDSEFLKELEWANKSEHVKRYREFKKMEIDLEAKRKEEKLKSWRIMKLNEEAKRSKNEAECKLHGGPFRSLEAFNVFCEAVAPKTEDKALQEILNKELRFQKENVMLFHKTSEVYKFYNLHPKTKKRILIPTETKMGNMRTLLASVSNDNQEQSQISHSVAPEKILSSLDEICQLFDGESSTIADECDDEALLSKYPVGETAAFMFIYQDEDNREYNDWSLGQIRKAMKSKDCTECQKNNTASMEEITGVCMKARFYIEVGEGSKAKYTFNPKSKLWHCRYENVIKTNVELQQIPNDNYFYLPKSAANNITVLMKDLCNRIEDDEENRIEDRIENDEENRIEDDED